MGVFRINIRESFIFRMWKILLNNNISRRIEYFLMKLQLLVESQIYSFRGYVVYFIMNVSTQKQMDFNVG